ncbi:hypothetical protein U1Q18_039691 [Sarracenia purpurea var. burkii]
MVIPNRGANGMDVPITIIIKNVSHPSLVINLIWVGVNERDFCSGYGVIEDVQPALIDPSLGFDNVDCVFFRVEGEAHWGVAKMVVGHRICHCVYLKGGKRIMRKGGRRGDMSRGHTLAKVSVEGHTLAKD